MHEMTLAENILKIVEQAQQRDGFSQLRRVVIDIGALAGVEIDAMQFCLEAISENTVLANAEILIEKIPALGRCRQCGTAVQPESLYESCPHCGGFDLQLQRGQEIQVSALEVI